jgi:hypothetical protein
MLSYLSWNTIVSVLEDSKTDTIALSFGYKSHFLLGGTTLYFKTSSTVLKKKVMLMLLYISVLLYMLSFS